MKVSLNCKFCKLPITVEIDDEYAQTHDRFKLLSYAACNHCADVRETRRSLTERIKRAAFAFAAMSNRKEADKDRARKIFSKLLTLYAANIAKSHRMEGMVWDDAVVEDMMECPGKWPDVLSLMHNMFNDWKRQRDAEARQKELAV